MTNLHDGRKLPVIVLHAEVEDYGLDPYQMRVYIRIVRRAGRGECFETVANMAKGCEMSTGSVKKAIKFLIDHRFITRHESGAKEGRASRYRLTDPELWIHAKEGGGHHTTQVVTDPGGGHHTTQGVATTDPGGGHVVATEEDPFKKIPLSVFPLNENREPESKNETASPSEPPQEINFTSLDGGQQVSATQQRTGSEIENSAALVLPPSIDEPADLFTAQAVASEIRMTLRPSGKWDDTKLKVWAELWQKSDRSPGANFINLKAFIRKNVNPKAEKHGALLDEWEVVKPKLEPKATVPASTFAPARQEYAYDPDAIAKAKALMRGGAT